MTPLRITVEAAGGTETLVVVGTSRVDDGDLYRIEDLVGRVWCADLIHRGSDWRTLAATAVHRWATTERLAHPPPLTDRERIVRALPGSSKEVALATGLAQSVVLDHLRALLEHGRVRKGSRQWHRR